MHCDAETAPFDRCACSPADRSFSGSVVFKCLLFNVVRKEICLPNNVSRRGSSNAARCVEFMLLVGLMLPLGVILL